MKVVFPFIAQLHQIPHSLPIAVELARRHPDIQVHVAYASTQHTSFIRSLVERCGAGTDLHSYHLQTHWLDRLRRADGQRHSKFLSLLRNRRFFADFDAIVTPEQTSLLLRKLGCRYPRFIWTRHGAGDREVGFSQRTREFDFVLMAGPKIERRLLGLRLIRPGGYATGVYAKFDWIRRQCPQPLSLFDNERPTVLYNPHFHSALTSWHRMGRQVLEAFASSTRYNLIFAPHVRLFDGAGARGRRWLHKYRNLPHIHIDLGSEHSIDMTYAIQADVYLGDVSSQVAEFLLRPRPCLFLNPHGYSWQGNPSFESWKLGPVSASTRELEAQLDEAIATHEDYRALQVQYLADTFDIDLDESSAAKGADAIATFLRRCQPAGVRTSSMPLATTALA